MKITKKRTRLLLELEKLVGDECYNANIQNWGPNGAFEGEGRSFTYPVTFLKDGEKLKYRWRGQTLAPQEVITGYYAFGATQLYIMRALDLVVGYLEEKHDLKI